MIQNKMLSFLFCSLPRQPTLAVATIIRKTPINHNCYIYQLKFVDGYFDLRIGEHFKITETIKTYDAPEGEEITRKYTPINPCSQKDVMDVLVKIYRPNEDIQYPTGGKLTPYLEKLGVGDKIHLEGPYGKFGYQPGGTVILDGKKKTVKRIFFVAGGSGITPCYQVIRQIVAMPEENVQLVLLFANKEEQDIILRKELQALQPRLSLHYILDKEPAGWKGYTGRISEQVMSQICPLNDPETLYVFCGPFGMNSYIKNLFKTKYPESTLFKF